MMRIVTRRVDVGVGLMCQACLIVTGVRNCERCASRDLTAFTCPNCNKTDYYYGYAAPRKCLSCAETWPSITGMKGATRIRKQFYFGEENV